MQARNGNVFEYVQPGEELVLIPANGTLCEDGSLVMWAGFAKQVAECEPRAPVILGGWVSYYARPVTYHIVSGQIVKEDRRKPCIQQQKEGLQYHLIIHPEGGQPYGLFQTKYYFDETARVDLIGRAATMLAGFASRYPDKRIHLPCPGGKQDGLRVQDIFAFLRGILIPDNITVWLE